MANKHPPLPEPGQLSEAGIDFIRQCLIIDPDLRPTATELMNHPWIVNAEEQIREMQEDEDTNAANSWAGMGMSTMSTVGTSSIGSTMTIPLLEEDEEEMEDEAGALTAVQEEA